MSLFDSFGDSVGKVFDAYADRAVEKILPPQHNPTPEAQASNSEQAPKVPAQVGQPKATAQPTAAAPKVTAQLADYKKYLVPGGLVLGGLLLVGLVMGGSRRD